jgi:hypothetical protein
MRLVLAHPPLDDPTLPYHSTAYLAGHLVHNGFTDVVTRDINIEFVNWTFEADVLHAFYDERRHASQPSNGRERLALWSKRSISAYGVRSLFPSTSCSERSPECASVSRSSILLSTGSSGLPFLITRRY